jgi:L-threonylcarbamoyladenylate synthase
MCVTDEFTARIARAAACLRAGGIVVYPTETFYGLGSLASRPDALARLAAAKLRPLGKPLPLIAADVEQVEEVASLASPLARRLARCFWPGPLTLILPALAGLDETLTGGTGSIAVRVPGSDIARALAARAGGALVSTSANLSGEPPPTRVSDLSPGLLAHLDAVLDGGETPGGLASTVVMVDSGMLRLVRAGVIPFADIEATARESGTGSTGHTS